MVTLTSAQLDTAMGLVHPRFPEAALRDIRFAPDGTLAINLFAPQAGPRAVDAVRVDATTPSVTSILKARDNPVLWLAVLPLHTGDSFGLRSAEHTSELQSLMRISSAVFCLKKK